METFIYNEEQTWKDRYFSSKGRLNRKPFIVRNIFVTAVAAALLFGLFGMVAAAGPDVDVFASGLLAMALMGVLFIVVCAVDIFLMIRRLHDLNLSGWLVLAPYVINIIPPYVINIIPYVGQALSVCFSLYLCIARGTEGDNQYGPDPLLREPYNVI